MTVMITTVMNMDRRHQGLEGRERGRGKGMGGGEGKGAGGGRGRTKE